jgi:hypothetical protein
MKKIIVILAALLVLFVSYKLFIIGVVLIKILIGLGVLILLLIGCCVGWWLKGLKK